MAFSILIAGDTVPTESNEEYFINGNLSYLFGQELLEVLEGADFRCFNLEVPLTSVKNSRKHPGPKMMAKPECINGLKALKPSLISLGNNHALDQGTEGCDSTMEILRKANVPFVGAGSNLVNARKPFVIEKEGEKIGIYNCSEYEFAAATDETSGANPYDPLETFDDIIELKKKCSKVIVLFHGGKEFYRYPSPMNQRISRKLVDVGADFVVWQHSHCIGCEEKYKSATICYGQGNFIFDRKTDEYRKNGMLIRLLVDNGSLDVSYIPVIKNNEAICLASDEEAGKIMEDFRVRSSQIKDTEFVRKTYEKFADENFRTYIKKIYGPDRLLRAINKLVGSRFTGQMYREKQALEVLNVISPENHSELFKTALRNRVKKNNK